MKLQLDKKALIAKQLTYKERLRRMKQRLAIKWNHEAVVEKAAIFVNYFLARYLLDFEWKTVFMGLVFLIIGEIINDLLTAMLAKRKMNIDMMGAGLRVADLDDLRGLVFSLATPSMACIVGFSIVRNFY